MVIHIDKNISGCIESRIGGRTENQDSAGVHDSQIGTVITVCDGMGGLNGGKVASMLAVKTIIDDVVSASAGDNPVEVLRNAVCHANELIVTAGKDAPALNGMGTTVTAMIVNRRCAVTAHLGDSRIYQLRSGHKVFRTADHSQVFESVRLGAMTEEDARTAEGSNVILRALGIADTVEPEINVLPYLSGDRFVLCTDGFWNPQSEPEFLKMVCRPGRPEKILPNLCKEIDFKGVREGGRHDNLTAAIFDVKNDSKLKTKMRKSLKVFIAALSLLLTVSVALNVYLLTDGNKEKTDVVTDVCDQTDVDNAEKTE